MRRKHSSVSLDGCYEGSRRLDSFLDSLEKDLGLKRPRVTAYYRARKES